MLSNTKLLSDTVRIPRSSEVVPMRFSLSEVRTPYDDTSGGGDSS